PKSAVAKTPKPPKSCAPASKAKKTNNKTGKDKPKSNKKGQGTPKSAVVDELESTISAAESDAPANDEEEDQVSLIWPAGKFTEKLCPFCASLYSPPICCFYNSFFIRYST